MWTCFFPEHARVKGCSMPACVLCVVSEVRSCCEMSPGVKSICYNPSDGHLSHSLRPPLTAHSSHTNIPSTQQPFSQFKKIVNLCLDIYICALASCPHLHRPHDRENPSQGPVSTTELQIINRWYYISTWKTASERNKETDRKFDWFTADGGGGRICLKLIQLNMWRWSSLNGLRRKRRELLLWPTPGAH